MNALLASLQLLLIECPHAISTSSTRPCGPGPAPPEHRAPSETMLGHLFFSLWGHNFGLSGVLNRQAILGGRIADGDPSPSHNPRVTNLMNHNN